MMNLTRPFGTAVLVLLSIAFTSQAVAQSQELPKGEKKEYFFSGLPAPTLCEQNPNFVCTTMIGDGTSFSRSSMLGSIITGNVCIIGDFEVNTPFRFQNATVKISLGVLITVAASPNFYDAGGTLEIDNFKLFACVGLWKGITLGFLSSISTFNNSKIEDAKIAIFANTYSSLSIQQTTFNQDSIGIALETPFPSNYSPGPQVWTFRNNYFTCDAPLNGTTNTVSFAGIKLKNTALYTFQTGTNHFTDLQYGIYAEGGASYIGAQGLIFQTIKRDGIYMEVGNIDLRSSTFTNCFEKGIHLLTARQVEITKGCSFYWGEVLPDGVDIFSFHDGICVERFSFASSVNVDACTFVANLTSPHKNVRGIHLQGGHVDAGTYITIANRCTWSFVAINSSAINISGDFPSASQITIYEYGGTDYPRTKSGIAANDHRPT